MKNIKSVYFLGIGGKGLNGIAEICFKNGIKVAGTDFKESPEIQRLRGMGIRVESEHRRGNLPADCDILVYSSLIKSDTPEILDAKEKGIAIKKRSEFLGEIMKNWKAVTVSGSHGKSTTTAMLGLALVEAGSDPTIFGGAFIKQIDSYVKTGLGELCVVEACEFDRSFHNLIGQSGIITSVEKSHPEYYSDEKEMIQSFEEFLFRHSSDSFFLGNGDDLNIRKISASARGEFFMIGRNWSNDYVIQNETNGLDFSKYDLITPAGKIIQDITLKIPGKYNVMDSALVLSWFDQNNLPIEPAKKSLSEFIGVGRRLEIKHLSDGTVLIDDVAHHPTQVKNLFEGIRQFYPQSKIYAVFEPRQFNLMNSFRREYGEAFQKADEVIVSPIISTLHDREIDKSSITTEEVANEISFRSRVKTKILDTYDSIADYLGSLKLGINSVIATIGPGDVNKVLDMLSSKNKVKQF